jgi:hypothetical protein
MCDKQELIVGYVYDELSREDQAALEQHLAACGSCLADVEELRATRGYLASWTPPEPDLGFRVIRGGAAPAAAVPRRFPLAPAFALAAAAVIVLAVAAAIANVEIRYGGDGMTVRTGWGGSRPAEASPAGVRPDVALASESGAASRLAEPAPASGDFAELDRRLREIEAALNAPPPAAAGVQMAASTSQGMTDAEMLRRVREIVKDAEARQETAVAQLLLQVWRDFEVQRRADLAAMQQGLGTYQGLTNAEIAQNREMVNQLVRAATTSKQEK